MGSNFSLLVSIVLLGILYIALAIPLVNGLVPRNPIYGFRTPKTLSSDRYWYPANRFSGNALIGAGTLTIAGALVLLPFAGLLSPNTMLAFFLLLATVPPIGALIQSLRYLRKL